MFRTALEWLSKNSVDGQTSDMQNVPNMDTETAAKPDSKPPKPSPKPVAIIHANFTIRGVNDEPATGEITLTEQIRAVERFVRWHTRQAEVGQSMLKKLDSIRKLSEMVNGPETVPAPTPVA